MAILSKGSKSQNFESHNSLKFSFTNVCGLCLNFIDCGSFLESNSPDISALCEKNLDHSINFGNFSVMSYLLLIQKDSITHIHVFAVYVYKDFLLYKIYHWKSLWILTYAFHLFYFTQCLTAFSSADHILHLYIQFLIVSTNIDEVLLINPSANVFVFGDFNIHHKDWLVPTLVELRWLQG